MLYTDFLIRIIDDGIAAAGVRERDLVDRGRDRHPQDRHDPTEEKGKVSMIFADSMTLH